MKLHRKITHLLLLIGVVRNSNAAHDEPLSVFPEKGFIRARKARVEIAGYDLRQTAENKAKALGFINLSSAVFCHPPIGFSEGYSFAFLLSDINGKLECVRGISETSVVQVSMENSEELTLYLNCPREVSLRDPKLGQAWFVKSWKVLHYGGRSNNLSVVAPCPPCDAYAMQGGWALKNKEEASSYERSLATFDTTTQDYSYNEGKCDNFIPTR